MAMDFDTIQMYVFANKSKGEILNVAKQQILCKVSMTHELDLDLIIDGTKPSDPKISLKITDRSFPMMCQPNRGAFYWLIVLKVDHFTPNRIPAVFLTICNKRL